MIRKNAKAKRQTNSNKELIGLFQKEFKKVNSRFDGMAQRFDKMDQRFDKMDQRFDKMDQRFEGVDRRFAEVDKRLDKLDNRITDEIRGVKSLIEVLDRKFTDAMLPTQMTAEHECLNQGPRPSN